jgi:chemotaxis protein methyltransferase WspC
MNPLGRIEELLRRQIGLLPSTIGVRGLELAVDARMRALGTGERLAYLGRLMSEGAEMDALIEELVVPETWFFRDEEPFRYLARWSQTVWPELARAAPLRVLSIPCSTGEEPYSVAMALLEAGVSPARLHIDAFDISERALQIARRGVYRRSSFRGNDLEFRDRHFVPLEDGSTITYEIAPELREAVRFRRGNLLDPTLFAVLDVYDVIFCRNVLIYFTKEARQTALDLLESRLGRHGVLFVGHADSVDDPRFAHVAASRTFALRRAESGTKATGVTGTFTIPIPFDRTRATTGTHAVRPTAPPPRNETGRYRSLTPAPLSAVSLPPTATPAAKASEAARLELAAAEALADQGRLEEAAALCEAQLGRAPSPPAFRLLGVIRLAQRRDADAEHCFQRVLYLDPTHRDALLHLALLADKRADARAAANYRRRAAATDAPKEHR